MTRIGLCSPRFQSSPLPAYEVHDDKNAKGKSLVVTDGQEGRLYDEVVDGSMSLFSGDGSVTYVAREGRKFYRVTQHAG